MEADREKGTPSLPPCILDVLPVKPRVSILDKTYYGHRVWRGAGDFSGSSVFHRTQFHVSRRSGSEKSRWFVLP